MVAREFLEELKSVSGDFDWKFEGGAQRIRAKLKSRPNGLVFDPIGALCYSKTGLILDEENWFRASREIELSHIDAGDLTAAANNVCGHPDHYYTQYLRRQMISIVLPHPETSMERISKVPGAIADKVSNLPGKAAHWSDRVIAAISKVRLPGSLYRVRTP
jgi:hypothetical protein